MNAEIPTALAPHTQHLHARPQRRHEELAGEAIERGLRLCLSYNGSERYLSPYEVITTGAGARAVIGWDHDREGFRTFRFDRCEGSALVACARYDHNQEDSNE